MSANIIAKAIVKQIERKNKIKGNSGITISSYLCA